VASITTTNILDPGFAQTWWTAGVTARTKRRESYFVDSAIIQETKLKRRREEDRCRRQRSMYTDAIETRLR